MSMNNLTKIITRSYSTIHGINRQQLIRQITRDKFMIRTSQSTVKGVKENKVLPSVELTFNVWNASWLPHEIRENILEQEHDIINERGELKITSNKTFSAYSNTEDAINKIRDIVDLACCVPETHEEELNLQSYA